MSTIKAVDKLREWSRWLDGTYATDDGKSYNVYSHQPYDGMKSCGEHMREQCNEIEAEIEERYTLLPLDADGVPIRVGDVLESDISGEKRVWMVSADGFAVYGDCSGYNPKAFRHIKRTLEDVLFEFGEEFEGEMNEIAPIIVKYAEEIRELLGVRE